jgi:hypothetical protein
MKGDRTHNNTLAQAKTEYEIRLGNIRALENAQKRTEQVYFPPYSVIC